MTMVQTETAALAVCEDVGVGYGADEGRVIALSGIDLTLAPGEKLALWGPSGSGKTTLLHVLGGLVAPTHGAVRWKGTQLAGLDVGARGRARAGGIAYVFQGSNLLTNFTAYENVSFALHVSTKSPPAELRSDGLLALVGLSAKLDALPAELSGGEAQRVAIARALAQRPDLLLCDEPTGHLDSDTGERVLDLVDVLQHEFGFALVTATHDANVAARYGRLVEMLDGRIVDEGDRTR